MTVFWWQLCLWARKVLWHLSPKGFRMEVLWVLWKGNEMVHWLHIFWSLFRINKIPVRIWNFSLLEFCAANSLRLYCFCTCFYVTGCWRNWVLDLCTKKSFCGEKGFHFFISYYRIPSLYYSWEIDITWINMVHDVQQLSLIFSKLLAVQRSFSCVWRPIFCDVRPHAITVCFMRVRVLILGHHHHPFFSSLQFLRNSRTCRSIGILQPEVTGLLIYQVLRFGRVIVVIVMNLINLLLKTRPLHIPRRNTGEWMTWWGN